MNSAVKNIIFWVVMAVTALLIWAVVKSSTGERVRELTFTEFINEVSKDNVREVTIAGTEVSGALKKDNVKFSTTSPPITQTSTRPSPEKKVNVIIKDNSSGSWMTWVANGLPMLLLLGLWIFFMRQMQSGGNKALSFGKSRARLLSSQQKKVTFKDVAGVDEAKEELQEIIEFLREPQKFQKLGGRIPKGVLLVGPAGHRQDAAGAGGRRRSQRSVLLDLRLGFRGDVCRRGRFPRPRPVRTGQEECPLHHLHRRN